MRNALLCFKTSHKEALLAKNVVEDWNIADYLNHQSKRFQDFKNHEAVFKEEGFPTSAHLIFIFLDKYHS